MIAWRRVLVSTRFRGALERAAGLASRARASWVPVALALLPFAFMWDFVLGRAWFWFFDVRYQWLPWQAFVRDSILRGDAPFWNPYVMLGFSQVGESQVGMFYPLNALMAFGDLQWRFALVLCVHLAGANVGMYLLLRYVGLGRAAAAVGAISFGLSGYMFAQMRNYVIVQGSAYLPFFVLWLTRYFDTKRLVYLGLVSLGVGFSLCIAHAGTTFMILGGVTLYSAFRLRNSDRIVQDGALYLAAIALGFLFASVQVLPLLEIKPLSERAQGLSVEYAVNPKYQSGFLRKLAYFFPWMLGSTRGSKHAFGYEEFHYYSGVCVPILAAVGALAWKTFESAQRRFLAAVCGAGGIAFVLTLGDQTPLFNPWRLLMHLPGFGMFRVPARWGCIFTFALSVLAAFGFQALRERPLRVRILAGLAVGLPTAAVLAAIAEAGVPGVARFFSRPKRILLEPTNAFETWIVEPLSRMNPVLLYAALALPFLLLYWAFFKNKIGARRFGLGVVALLLLDLFLIETPLNPRTTDHGYFDWNPRQAILRGRDRYCRVMPPLGGGPQHALPHNTAAYFRVFSTMGSTPLDLKNFQDIRSKYDRPAVLDYVGACAQFRNGAYESRTTAFPRAFMAFDVRDAGSLAPFDRFIELDREAMRSTVYVSTSEYAAARISTPSAKTPPEQRVEIRRFENDLVRLEVETSSPGMVVMTDMMYPGWTATLDGKPTRIHAAQGMFRGVGVPAGKHEVRFEFRPPSVYYGAALSGLSLTVFAALLVVFRRRLFA